MGLIKLAGQAHDDNELQERAIQAGIAAAKKVVGDLAPTTQIKTLSDQEWGWIVSATLCGWICERSKVISERGIGQVEQLLVTLNKTDPEPWEMGAASAVLPALGEVVSDLGIAEKAIGEWSKDEVIVFVWRTFFLMDAARCARDQSPNDSIPF